MFRIECVMILGALLHLSHRSFSLTSRFERKFSASAVSRTSHASTSGREIRKTGAFKSILPDIFDGRTHFKRALRSLKTVKADKTIKNVRNRDRKFAAQSLDTLMKGLTVPITETLAAYKKLFKEFHPYEATVADLTVVARVKTGLPNLDEIISNLKILRAKTSKLAKEFASQASNATSAQEAKELLDQGMKELQTMYEETIDAKALEDLLGLQKDLRRIPVIELDVPSVVLVGSPNVGKSSIVRAVSSGTPEVNDYPFTTRGVTVGHIVDRERDIRFQVMDTPGLLDRPDTDRNEMERLTFASLAHLPTAVIFVIDPTGLSGDKSTLAAQLNVRNYLRSRFPRRPWIDVLSKADIPLAPEVLQQMPQGHLAVSVKSGHNIEILKIEIEEMMFALQDMLAAPLPLTALDGDNVDGEEEEDDYFDLGDFEDAASEGDADDGAIEDLATEPHQPVVPVAVG